MAVGVAAVSRQHLNALAQAARQRAGESWEVRVGRSLSHTNATQSPSPPATVTDHPKGLATAVTASTSASHLIAAALLMMATQMMLLLMMRATVIM